MHSSEARQGSKKPPDLPSITKHHGRSSSLGSHHDFPSPSRDLNLVTTGAPAFGVTVAGDSRLLHDHSYSSRQGPPSTHGRRSTAPSPLRHNSPTKRFGHLRWPPLVSPRLDAADMHTEDHYADVRLEMERSGHNLTSVLLNPKGDTSELEAAMAEHPSAVIAVQLPPVDMGDVMELRRRTGHLCERYTHNHYPQSLGQTLNRVTRATPRSPDVAAGLAECFRAVPNIFFSTDFQLSEPSLFEALVVNATPDTQERLGQYLDIVETCLLKQISARSQHFFEALTTLQAVRRRVSQACHQVARLRRGLHDIDRKTVLGMISIPRLAQRKVNVASLVEKLRLMQEVQKSKELVQSLLSAGDYMAALDLLEDARALLREGLAGIQCMKKLERQLSEYLDLVADLMGTSFINLAVKIDDEVEMSEGSDGTTVHRCLNQATAMELIPRVRGLVRLCRLSKVLERYRLRMVDTLKVVVKTVMLEYLDIADYSYAALDEEEDAKLATQSSGASHEVTDNTPLSARVKAMEPSAFSEAVQLCFEQLLLPMDQIAAVHRFLDDQMSVELTRLLERRHTAQTLHDGEDASTSGSTTDSTSSLSSPAGVQEAPSPGSLSQSGKFKAFLDQRRAETRAVAVGVKAVKDDDQVKVLELEACKRLNDEILKSLCDLCQRHISSLLVIRKEAHMKLSLPEMKTLWDATIRFVSAIERISGTAGFGLKSTLLTQAKLFLEHVHDTHVTTLASVLDSERWTQADVSPERQAELDRLTAGKAVLAMSQPSSFSDDRLVVSGGAARGRRLSGGGGRAGSDAEELLAGGGAAGADGQNGVVGSAAAAAARKKKVPAEAVVEDTRYKVVWSALLLVSMLMNYLNIAANFPVLAVDVVNRVVDILRAFNTRTMQLVLGAGAIHTAARLRSISAKHLGLASQCLCLIMVLTPHARAALSAHLTPKQQAFLVELDRVKQEYLEHHEKILTKFVSIIGELVANSASTGLQDYDWDSMNSAPCRFIEDTIRGVTTLHKVLHQHLPAPQVQDVFSRIFDLLTHRVREYFENIQPTTTAGRQRLVDEISHLVTSLSMLRGVSAEPLKLDEHFRRKFVQ